MKKKVKDKMMLVRFTEAQLKAIDKEVIELGLDRSKFIRQLLKEYFNKKGV